MIHHHFVPQNHKLIISVSMRRWEMKSLHQIWGMDSWCTTSSRMGWFLKVNTLLIEILAPSRLQQPLPCSLSIFEKSFSLVIHFKKIASLQLTLSYAFPKSSFKMIPCCFLTLSSHRNSCRIRTPSNIWWPGMNGLLLARVIFSSTLVNLIVNVLVIILYTIFEHSVDKLDVDDLYGYCL